MLMAASLAAFSQTAEAPAAKGEDAPGWRQAGSGDGKTYTVDPGTKLPLSLINSVSTKHSAQGDRVYLETAFPIVVNGRVVIPAGSYVMGTVTQVKRPGKVKGRGELFVRFDSLTLPNGVTRDFRGRLDGIDGRSAESFDREEGRVSSEGNKSGDARNVGEAASAGASVGAIAGAASGSWGKGLGIGAGAGAAAGLIGVLFSRGPDAVLAKGSTVEMVLDRSITFDEPEVDFGGPAAPARRMSETGGGPLPSKKSEGSTGVGFPGRRF
jgi:type IV secretion system protein VirB10